MGRKCNSRGLALLKSFEGCELEAYPDPGTGGEPWTIGWGHTGGVKKGDKITQAEADDLLAEDLERFEEGVARYIGHAPATDDQFSACVCLAFNIGLERFRNSTVLKRHRLKNYTGAANAFLLWKYAGGRVMKGLMRRREAERRLYLGLPV
jgi:lysozyme